MTDNPTLSNRIDPNSLHSEAAVIKWYMPVIDALIAMNGEATKRDAIQKIIEMNHISRNELERTIKCGDSALIRTIEFARNDLRVEGFIDGSIRGIWKLTDIGKQIIISEELAGKIRAKSVRVSNVRGKNRKYHEDNQIPVIDLTPYYRFRENHGSNDTVIINTEQIADEALISEIQEVALPKVKSDFRYKGIPKEKEKPMLLQGRLIYPRNKNVSINALMHAKFRCEINADHLTFLRKQTKIPYTEPHHLVPMAYQGCFNVSLDVEENIVSLCCMCHKLIHYGADAVILLEQLYLERRERLESVGIHISLDDLCKMYDNNWEKSMIETAII